MDNRVARMVRAIRLQLEDGGLTSDDEVLILSSTDNYRPLVDAYVSAVASFGADPILLTYTAPPPLTGLPDAIVDVAIRADLVIDLSFKSWAYTESHERFMLERAKKDASKRLGVVGQTFGWEEDVYHLIELTPDPEVKERSRRAHELIDKAQTIRLKSPLGTDLVVQRGDPSRYVTYSPAGQAAFGPPEDGVDGLIYYQGGFRIQFPSVIRRMVHEPVRMEVHEGKIVNIARDTDAGIMLDDWFRSHNDPNSYQFAHMNLGLDPRIELHRLDNISVHFNYAATLIAFGTNFTPIFGTGVRAMSHIDMNSTGNEYWVDNLCLVRDGKFTEESGLQGPFSEVEAR